VEGKRQSNKISNVIMAGVEELIIRAAKQFIFLIALIVTVKKINRALTHFNAAQIAYFADSVLNSILATSAGQV